MPPEMSSFATDHYLKRYEKALEHLSKCAPQKTFEDVLVYVQQHSLYREAIKLFKDQREKYDVHLSLYKAYPRLSSDFMPVIFLKITMLLMPDSVKSSVAFLLTILAYDLVGDKKNAIEAYTKANLWRECLNAAYSIPMPPNEIVDLANKLAQALIDQRQFAEAARLYIDYGNDDVAVEKAVQALAKGYQFTEAIRVVCPKTGQC